jgi:hypothetical protein
MTIYLKYLISCDILSLTKKYVKAHLFFMSFILIFYVKNKIKITHGKI